MHRSEIHRLDQRRAYWVPAVVAPHRDWAGAPGCRSGARFLVDRRTFRANRERFPAFDSQLDCLRWIMRNRPISTGRFRRRACAPLLWIAGC